jgi:hypothetical protein
MSEYREADQVIEYNIKQNKNTQRYFSKQTEKAYQKQDGIFVGGKKVLGKKTKKVTKLLCAGIKILGLNL